MLQKAKKMPEIAAMLLLLIGAAVFFGSTNPSAVQPAILMVGFGWIAAIVCCLVIFILRATGLKSRIERSGKVRYRAVLVGVTLLPVLLLAMQSTGQLAGRDLITLAVFYAAGYFYVSRIQAGTSED